METSLIEVCVMCGFAHRDDRTTTRQRKPHYHWTPDMGEDVVAGSVIHATVCVACVTSPIDWSEYAQARNNTHEEFHISTSYNATLPFPPTDLLTSQYLNLCTALKADSTRW